MINQIPDEIENILSGKKMPSYMPLPYKFQKTYLDRDTYPRNIIQKTVSTYPSALAAFADRLDYVAPNLFESDVTRIEVPIRDLRADDGCGEELDKLNINSPNELTDWFGLKVVQDPQDPSNPVVAVQRKDPKCRFVYLYGYHSRARLRITRSMLLELFTFHQVMPDYLDFISAFGLQDQALDLGFSSFREQKTLKLQHGSSGITELGRSGMHYQLCYNLKGVTFKHEDSTAEWESKWSIRQAAFYHRFDVVGGNTLWIVTKGGLDIQQRFKELTGKDARPEDKAFETTEDCFRSSLSAHLLFCHWSTQDWRGYIKWLEFTISRATSPLILGPTGKKHNHHISSRDIQGLQRWSEKAREIASVLRSNAEVMKSLQRFYNGLSRNEDFSIRKSCGDDIADFASQLGNIIDDFKLQIDRADALVQTTADRMELAKQQRLERLNRNLEKEAIIVRIITIVTLIYLPATFVSTFFSTDVVKYQGQEQEHGNFSRTALLRWVQVTFPLTALTILFAYVGKRLAERRSQQEIVPIDVNPPSWLFNSWHRSPREISSDEKV